MSKTYEIIDNRGCSFIAYYSLVGSSQVPYPYALGENYAYFILDKKVVDVDFIDSKKDGYTQYYMNINNSDKNSLRTKSIQKRIY